MDYRQLLNPKGFAKEKSKKEPSGHVKKAGDQSSPNTKPTPIRFDPKALLDPKAAAGRSKSSQVTNGDSSLPTTANGNMAAATVAPSDLVNQPGLGSMIEKLNHIGPREAASARKRKSEHGDSDDDDDTEPKKAKFTSKTSGSGVLGHYVKTERDKGAAANGPTTEPIDLTKDDDDDEIVYVGEKMGDDNKEVCLGRLYAEANVHKIPVVPKYQQGKVGKDHWPQTRINYRRLPGPHKLIELYDKSSENRNVGTKIGTMHGKLAAVLSPLIDGEAITKIRLKMFLGPFKKDPGELLGGRVSRTPPLNVIVYAPRNRADGIGRRLALAQYFLADPHGQMDQGFELDNPHVPKVLGGLGKVGVRKPQAFQPNYGITRTQEEMVRETATMFDNLIKTDELPEMEANSSLIQTPLMSHQKQALCFLVDHERDSKTVSEDETRFSLWKPRDNKKGQVYYNIITDHELPAEPELSRGGILADVMGLGKTLSVLALIAETLDDALTFGGEEAPVDAVDLKRNAKATLIICPKSVMANWQEQIKAHTTAGRFKVYAYHGTNRTQDVDDLAEYDIVLTTYNTAAAEFSNFSKRRSALGSVQWFRIVLDEAHQIRNASTHVSKACCALSAQRRWALTGTPVQNRLDDLGALIKFLRIKPFDDISAWTRHIIAPFRNANENVLQHLKLLVASITLRRGKDKIGLTQRNEQIQRLEFSDPEMDIYRQFSQQSNIQLKIMLSKTNSLRGKSYAHVLKSLTRLRQLCAHGKEMLNEDDLKELEGMTAATAIDLGEEPDDEPDDSFISEKAALETLNMMTETEVDICINCNRKINDSKADDEGVVDLSDTEESDDDSEESATVHGDNDMMGYLTPCYHLVCPKCKEKYLSDAGQNLTEDAYHRCSYCEQYVRYALFGLKRSALKAMLDSRSKKNKKGKAKWDESTYSGPHTKVKALLNDLKKSQDKTAELSIDEPPIRSVVFSGWTSYLDLIEVGLEEHGHGYVRLDGSMSVKARSAVLQTFATDPAVTILLVSIKAGGQGLNFITANKVYMMEPQFNPGVEQQAIDRVHRLGQKRDVEITHFIMKESVEEKILVLQEKKEKLAKLSMEGNKISKSEEAKKKIEELRDLFK